MSEHTGIEWTDRTWNPVTGCSKVSPGCAHCYAETVADRFWAKQYPKVEVERVTKGALLSTIQMRPRQFTDIRAHADRLDQPLHWRKPSRIFVNSMSDLFHEDVPDEFISRVFAVMALTPQHTYQILTKRAGRMHDYLNEMSADPDAYCFAWAREYECDDLRPTPPLEGDRWPLQNVWLGVSVENQHFANERIPLLIKTPTAIRFISAEPLLEKILLDDGCNSWLTCTSTLTEDEYEAMTPAQQEDHNCCESFAESGPPHFRGIDWVIVGGESGLKARVLDVAWVRSIIAQCKEACVPVFVKQMGRDLRKWKNPKGGDPAEWSEDLRVREFPR